MKKFILFALVVMVCMIYADTYPVGPGDHLLWRANVDSVAHADSAFSDTFPLKSSELEGTCSVTWQVKKTASGSDTHAEYLYIEYTNDPTIGWFHRTCIDSIIIGTDLVKRSSCSWQMRSYHYVQFIVKNNMTTDDIYFPKNAVWFKTGK